MRIFIFIHCLKKGKATSSIIILAIYFYKKINRPTRLFALFSFLIILVWLFYWKIDSVSGRFLIWECAFKMVKDHPIIGHGHNGFQNNYMNYQKDYFEINPNSKYSYLAGNTHKSFNEYLLVLVNYGTLFFLFLILIILKTFKIYFKTNDKTIRTFFSCLLVIFMLSFFSYPFSYPFTWFVLIISYGNILVYKKGEIISKVITISPFWAGILKLTIFVFIIITIQKFYWELRWYKANQANISPKEISNEYNILSKKLDYNVLFQYNHAAILNKKGDYNRSLLVANSLYKEWSDYNLEILIAHNHMMNHTFYQSEKHFRNAHNMCPSKFVPLYGLFLTYKKKGNLKLAKDIATLIKNKKIKINSNQLELIKKDVDNFLLNEK